MQRLCVVILGIGSVQKDVIQMPASSGFPNHLKVTDLRYKLRLPVFNVAIK